MPARSSPQAKGALSATKSAATGRGDLLRAWVAGVEQAPSLLGYEGVPVQPAQAHGSLPKQQERPLPEAPRAVGAVRRTPLKMPRAYSIAELTRDQNPEPEELLQWTPMGGAEWAAYFRHKGPQPLVVEPLWPDLSQVRGWLDAAAARQPGRQVDWPDATRRLATGQALQRLPLRAQAAMPADVHLLIDGSPAFQALEGDARVVMAHLLRLCGRSLHVWRWSAGVQGVWSPVGTPNAQPPAQLHGSLLLVFSDFGVVAGGGQVWQQALRGWAQQGAQLHLLFPGLPHELPGWVKDPAVCVPAHVPGEAPTWPAPADPLERLLQALSVAMVLDAPLVRRVRQWLCPGSSPLLELQVAQHPAIWQRELGLAQWRHAQRSPYQTALADARQWPSAQCEDLAKVLVPCHTHLSQAVRDEELLELASLPQLAEAADQPTAPETQAAAERVARALGTLREALLPLANASVGSSWQAYVSARCHRVGAGLRQRFPELSRRLAVVEALQAIPAGQPLRAEPPDSPELDAVAPPVQLLKLWLCQDAEGLWLVPALNEADVPRKAVLSTIQAGGRWLRVDQYDVLLGVFPLHGWRQPKRMLTVDKRWDGLRLTFQLVADSTGRSSQVQRMAELRMYPMDRPRALENFAQTQGDATTLLDTPFGLVQVRSIRVGPNELWGGSFRARSKLPRGVMFLLDRYGALMDVELSNGPLVLRLRYLPPGTFLMGSPDGEGASDEHPQHPVTLTEGFWMAEVPCTQALWQAVMGNNPSHFKYGADAPQRPVEQVSFDDVTQFLKKLTVLLPDGVEAVLPTEAQWDYACRAGSQTAYWWGDDFDPARANVDHANNKDWNDKDGTTPVNCYLPNPWGLFDMHGNVWEWCADGRREYTKGAVVNPRGPVESGARVVRGGSWFLHPDYASSASRLGRPGGSRRTRDQGFRLVLRSYSPGSEGQV